MDLGLKGKVALVVAASKGMGKASALGLAAEGARVVMCARGEADLTTAAAEVERQTGAEVLAVPADASGPGRLERRGGGHAGCGGVDVLVANVGGPPPARSRDDRRHGASVRAGSSLDRRFISEVLPGMKRARWGASSPSSRAR